MGNIFRYYVLLTRRWMWVLVLGALVCGSATYLISTFLRPVYQASAYLIIDIGGASTHPSITDSLQAVPTFAQLITTSTVLDPVLAQHPGLSSQDLLAMLTVKPQTNTQIIELDVQTNDPHLAADLANQVSWSFAQYANASQQDTVQIIPAQTPTLPAQPRPLEDAGIGSLVGVLLVLILIVGSEWVSNRATSVEQIQELLGTEIMTMVPCLPRHMGQAERQQTTLEKYHMICASLNVAQASRPFKLVMFTSALAGEGKTTIVSNVAVNLAQAGKQVLLIDLNIHRPALAQRFHLDGQFGLTNLLLKQGKRLQVEQYSQASEVPGLHVLTAGTQQMTSSRFLQALAATQFFSRLKQAPFDYILCDAPPLFAVAETQILAHSIEAMVLVVNGSRTPRKVLDRTRQVLWRIQTTRVLGTIVNQSSWRDYADTHPYALPQPVPEPEPQFSIEQITMELPAMNTALLVAPKVVVQEEQTRLPDTGETEQIRSGGPDYVIRPNLSLSGLTGSSGNGLTRRDFSPRTPPPVSQPLQHMV